MVALLCGRTPVEPMGERPLKEWEAALIRALRCQELKVAIEEFRREYAPQSPLAFSREAMVALDRDIVSRIDTSPLPALVGMVDAPIDALLRLSAVMLHLGSRASHKSLLPKTFLSTSGLDRDACVRMVLFKAQNARKLQAMRDAGISRVRIVAAQNCCPACAELKGVIYSIDKIPEMPHVFCASSGGCRCTLAAILTES